MKSKEARRRGRDRAGRTGSGRLLGPPGGGPGGLLAGRGAGALCVAAAWLAVVLAACAAGSNAVGGQGPAAVAVWEFEDLSAGAPPDPGTGDLLAVRVMEAARRAGHPVVERQRLLAALEELRLGSSALADEATRLRLGRITGARRMVFGGYLAAGGTVRMDLRLVDVETGRVVRTASRAGRAGGVGDLIALCGEAAEALFAAGGKGR